EIGQIVVGKKGTRLAVGAFQGTDACLTRGGELAGKEGGAVAVKAAKEKHDMRFDIPCIGTTTVEVCHAANLSVLAIEAGKSLVLEQDKVEELARKWKISIVTV